MNALQIECTSAEWWGDCWADRWPHAIVPSIASSDDLPNAPVTIYVLTSDAAHAAKLLRLAADALERNPAMCAPPAEFCADKEHPF